MFSTTFRILSFLRFLIFLNPKRRTTSTGPLALPFFTTLKVDDLGHDTSKAIATHCPQLEVLIDYKKPKITYAADILNELSALESILQSCPNLRVLDALGHRLVVSVIMETPWTTTKLETLRCQIRNLNRLDRVEEEDTVVH
ncbi:hypothetical protein BGZ91_001491 [Linnemannia elongata]|nr:hypothetical protein BGZ91_001491 [Linnemannia elongata]